MNFEIIPHVGVGVLRFEMNPDEVRALISSPYRSFKRTPLSAHPCDHFTELGAFAYYDALGRAEAFEFTKRAKASYAGVNLFEFAAPALIRHFSGLGVSVTTDADGITIAELGFGAYVPDGPSDPKAEVEAVIAFRPGYYD